MQIWIGFVLSTVSVLSVLVVVWRKWETPVGQMQLHIRSSKIGDVVMYLWGTLTAQGLCFRPHLSIVSNQ